MKGEKSKDDSVKKEVNAVSQTQEDHMDGELDSKVDQDKNPDISTTILDDRPNRHRNRKSIFLIETNNLVVDQGEIINTITERINKILNWKEEIKDIFNENKSFTAVKKQKMMKSMEDLQLEDLTYDLDELKIINNTIIKSVEAINEMDKTRQNKMAVVNEVKETINIMPTNEIEMDKVLNIQTANIKEGVWREKNKSNSILYGLVESKTDKESIDEICNILKVKIPMNVFRIGTIRNDKPRLLKSTFNYKQDNFLFYQTYVKNKKLNNWNYNLGNDLTKIQQQNLKKIKAELKELPTDDQQKKKIILKNGEFTINNKVFLGKQNLPNTN